MVWLALAVVVVVACGVALRRGGDTERAVEETIALAFAASAGLAGVGSDPSADRAFLTRHRLVRPGGRGGGVVLVRTYVVPGDLSPEQATALAGEPIASGSTLAARAASPRLAELLLALTAPGFLDRAAVVTGVSAARLRAALRSRGLDLDARSIGGSPWTRAGRGLHVLVVDAPGGQPLADARRLDPGAKPGDRWEFPTLEERLPRFFDGLLSSRPGAFTFVRGGVAEIEAHRSASPREGS